MPEYAIDYELDFSREDCRGQNIYEPENPDRAEDEDVPLCRFT